MITLLRKIRKRLIARGNFSSYLLYAIGEIALVVLGILIALQINNWNEQRKEKREERIALNDLKFEFEKNRANFLTHAEWQKGVGKSWETYLSIISNKSLSNAERAITRPRIGNRNFKITNSKLNSLFSTGVIDKIKNDSLKKLLLNWNDVLIDFQNIEVQHEYHSKNLISVEQALKPNPTLNRVSGIKNTFYNTKELEQINIKAINNMEYQNGLLLNLHWLKLKVGRHESIIQFLDQIIAQLNSSLTED